MECDIDNNLLHFMEVQMNANLRIRSGLLCHRIGK